LISLIPLVALPVPFYSEARGDDKFDAALEHTAYKKPGQDRPAPASVA